MRWMLGALVLVAACGSKKTPPPPVIPVPVVTTVTPPPPVDAAPQEPEPPPRATSPRSKLHLTLRSTPPGASVTVDGHLVGTTPVRHIVDDDGREHEFTFVLAGHVPWKLSFSPSRDGVIHATLVQAIGRDAG